MFAMWKTELTRGKFVFFCPEVLETKTILSRGDKRKLSNPTLMNELIRIK